MKVKVSDVKVGDRLRQNYLGIAELVASFQAIGQLSPIIVDEEYNLICGGRRLQAALELEWKEIEVEVKPVGDALEALRIEIEENTQRRKLAWYELVAGRVRFHTLMKDRQPSWRQSDTGNVFGVDQSTIAQDLRLHEALQKDERLAELTRNQAWDRILILAGEKDLPLPKGKDMDPESSNKVVVSVEFDYADWENIRLELTELVESYNGQLNVA